MAGNPPTKFMLIAGEASGDTLGAELVRALRVAPQLANSAPSFFGAGGPKLAAENVELALDLAAHAVVGIVEVLKNYRKFKGFFDQLLNLALERRPDVVILIDYPGFNLRFAKALRAKASATNWRPKIVYYVSPQIWAWHESRIDQIARDIDLLLAIFPFEKAWYNERKPNFRVEFIGHPLIDRFREFTPPPPRPAEAPPLLLLLPGSRVRELRKHLPPMVAAVRLLAAQHQIETRMVVPSQSLKELAQQFLNSSDRIELQVGGLAESLSQAHVAIASSGTVTMECAYFRVPTVVIYRTSASTYFLGRRFIKVKYLAMPNLLADKQIYPELIQDDASAEKIAEAATSFLNEDRTRNQIKSDLHRVIASLGETGASHRAAQAILANQV